MIVKDYMLVYCPICGSYFYGSQYLRNVFPGNDKQFWIATMITHYRHTHLNYYDRSVDFVSKIIGYERFKHLVNERIKRQLIRKTYKFMRWNGITVEHISNLQRTTTETMEIAKSLLLTKNQSTLEEYQ